jgi:hypothetical protein
VACRPRLGIPLRPRQLDHDGYRVGVANVTQRAPAETLAEFSTFTIVLNPAALPAVGGQHETRLAGVTYQSTW